MPSAADGAAQGLESGFRMAMAMQDRQRQATRDDIQDRRQAGLDQRAQEDHDYTRKRQANADELAAVNTQFADVGRQLQAHSNAGTTPPPELQALAEGVKAKRDAVMVRSGAYDPATVKANAQAGMQALQNKDMAFFQKNPGMLSQTLLEATGHGIEDFGPNGPIAGAVQGVQKGLETGDHESLIDGANVLFQKDLNKNRGQPAAQGGTNIGQRFVNLIPDPNSPPDDMHFIPTVRVFTNNGKQEASGDEIRARRSIGPDTPQGTTGFTDVTAANGRDPTAPADATGHYDTFITKNRSTDPNDPPLPISGKAAMDKVGQYGQLLQLLNSPEAAPLLQHEADSGWRAKRMQEINGGYGIEAPKSKLTTKLTAVPAGGSLYKETVDERGNTVKTETIQGNDKVFRSGSPQQKLDAIDGMVEDGVLTQEEGAARKRTLAATLTDPNKGRAPGGDNSGGLGLSSGETREITRQQASLDRDRSSLEKKSDQAVALFNSTTAHPPDFTATPAEKAEYTAKVKAATKARDDALAEVKTESDRIKYKQELIDKRLKMIDEQSAAGGGLGLGGSGDQKITPAVQAERDTNAGQILLAESGGAASAPARLKALRDAAANAKDGDSKKIFSGEADRLEKAMKANASGKTPPAKAGPTIAALPSGAKQIGTSGGKKVFQTPDGKKFVED